MAEKETWSLLSASRGIFVASGKKTRKFIPDPEKKKELLKIVLGRSGALRAPAIQIGDILYIGFNSEIYEQLLEKD
ncbi:MAG: hypothetical protein HY885_17065 [Deltaproteobacteria bacterium]|nr:hypothetical protein [Deltaproteobacteria bacterium]